MFNQTKQKNKIIFQFLFSGDHKQKFYWGHREILIPIYKSMSDAMKKHPDADVLINFASLRSAYESTIETLTYPQVTSKYNMNLYQNCRELEFVQGVKNQVLVQG